MSRYAQDKVTLSHDFDEMDSASSWANAPDLTPEKPKRPAIDTGSNQGRAHEEFTGRCLSTAVIVSIISVAAGCLVCALGRVPGIN